MTERLLQTKQVAEVLNCSTRTIYRLYRAGKLGGAFQRGGSGGPIMISAKALDQLKKSQTWRKG